MNKARVRFAPSPTGHLHIGGLRTALFNWLFARHVGGTYLVRIEDTDLERSRPEFTQAILDGLEWSNLMPDEPAVTQSNFMKEHKERIRQLLEEGKAYKCYCPAGSLQGEFIKYDSKCRSMNDKEQVGPYVVRLKLPDFATIKFDDLIRGPIEFSMDQFDDFIIARSDGSPVYNFVVVVDDARMNITHVIRGEDHISNTPKQIMLYEALGLKKPRFAHLPLILNEQGGRLSKRDAATSVLDYRKSGYLVDALCNYLVRLGWAHGDQELFTRDELIRLFTLEGVGKKGSVFDIQKLNWMNGMYMRSTSSKNLYEVIIKDIEASLPTILSEWSADKVEALIDLYKERSETLKGLVEELRHLYKHDREMAHEDLEKFTTKETSRYLEKIVNDLESIQDFTPDECKETIKSASKALGIKLGAVGQPIRLALTATTASPSVFELLSVLGKKESNKRIKKFIEFLRNFYSNGG